MDFLSDITFVTSLFSASSINQPPLPGTLPFTHILHLSLTGQLHQDKLLMRTGEELTHHPPGVGLGG